MSEQKGLYNKYTVINNETAEEVTECFVLKPSKDHAAMMAMHEYIRRMRPVNPTLANELHEWLHQLRIKGLEGKEE